MVIRRLLLLLAGAALLSNSAMAGPIPALPTDLPETSGGIAAAAADDPAGLREVLLNCAAAQGVVALVKGRAGMSSTGHDQMAIMLIHVAGQLPPADEWAASQAYGDKMFAFDQALQNDKTGTVQFDLLKLTQSCAVVEQYAEAMTAKEMADHPPTGQEPANPFLDEKQREDIIAELMGIKKEDAPAADAEPGAAAAEAAEGSEGLLLDIEKPFVAGLFADPADEATGYQGMLLDCAAYHGARWGSVKKKDKANEKAKETLFFEAAKAMYLGAYWQIDNLHATNIARYQQALANDETGETKKELGELGKLCARMEAAAQARVDYK